MNEQSVGEVNVDDSVKSSLEIGAATTVVNNSREETDDLVDPSREQLAPNSAVGISETSLDPELLQRLPALQESVSAMLAMDTQAWSFEKVEELLQAVGPDSEIRNSILQQNPQLAEQIDALEEKTEQARLQRARKVAAELQQTEAFRDVLPDLNLDEIPVEESDVDTMLVDPELKTIITRESKEVGSISTPEGKKTFYQAAIMVALLAWDISHGGRSLQLLANVGSEWILMKFGVDPKKAHELISGTQLHERMLFAFTKTEINQFFESRIRNSQRTEIVTFLSGISKEKRIKLLSGETVSPSGIGNTHQLEEPLLGKIIATLRPQDIDELGLKDVIAQRQTKTT